MNVSAPFIQRPIATSLLMMAILLLGLAAYKFLAVSSLPQVEIPTIEVSTSLPGASAQTMATTVTTPLERQLSLVPDITEMTSSSSLGNSSITLQFDINRNIDAAAQDVQGAINATLGQLPNNLPSPPTYEKANPADFLLMSLGIISDRLPISKVDFYADAYMAQQLSRIPGVGLIDFHGEQKPAVRIEIDPKKISALGLSLEDIRAVVNVATADKPKGTLDSDKFTRSIDVTDQLFNANEYNNLIIAYHNGAALRVRDIGRAVDSVEDVKSGAWIGTQRGIVLDIHKQYGFNVISTIAAIKNMLPRLQASMPSSVKVRIISDRTQTIQASVSEAGKSFIIAVALVILIIFAFLRSMTATLIASAAIPLSILGTLSAMYVLGYSINNISLMGLTIAVGFVIDDAVVMIENIIRRMEDGEEPLSAALYGARQISFTVISMTLSLIAVFIPLLMMGGVTGRLFHQFSATVSIALLVSAVVSLTLTPTLCRLYLNKDALHGTGGTARYAERFYNRLFGLYSVTLDLALEFRKTLIFMTLAIALATCGLYWLIPKGFFPEQDTGIIMCSTEAPPDVSAPEMSRLELQAARIIMKDPAVAVVYSWIGGDRSVNSGRIMVSLKPFGQRTSSAAEVMNRLKPQLDALNDIKVHMQARQELQIGGRGGKTQFQYSLEDIDTKELYAWTPKVMAILRKLPQIKDINQDISPPAPQTTIIIDRDAAGKYGISAQEIDDTLYDAFGQRQVATILTEIDQYHVIMELGPANKADQSAFNDIYLHAANGKLVPLSVVAHTKQETTPVENNHENLFPAITLSFNLAAGYALGDAVTAVEAAMHNAALPPTIHGGFQGTALAFKDALSTQPYLIAAAIIAVYIILGILYESYIHPITILSTLPSAGLGALLILIATGYDLDLISLVGIILLIGIVKKNAIMIIDFALDAEERQGLDKVAAVRQACLLRFRPIMMTTMAALLGSLPLMLASGAGSELRRPLGTAIVGGLIVSQILTVYTTPVIYLALHRFDKLRRKNKTS